MSTIKEIERRVGEGKKTKRIDLSELSLTALPGASALAAALSSKAAEGVAEFSAANNLIATISDASVLSGGLPGLRSVDLSQNNLSSVSERVFGDGAPAALERITLSRNRLSEFPQFVCSAGGSLTALDVSHNHLCALPADLFERLPSLTSLDLSFNALCALPAGITALSGTLRELRLRGNRLVRVAEGTLGALRGLTVLDLSGNKLTRLPVDLRRLDALEQLSLGGNPWEAPRADVCEAGRDAVFKELGRLAGAAACAATSRAADLRYAAAGECLSFAVVACDSAGVPRLTGGDNVTAELAGPENIRAEVADRRNGTYAVMCTPRVPGTYTLSIAVNGEPIPASPYTVHIWPSSSSSSSSTAEGSSGSENNAAIIKEVRAKKEKEKVEEEGEEGKLLAGAVAACREYNIPVEVPEIVVCGAAGYERIVEAIIGVFPMKIARGSLRRPLVLNFVYSEKVAAAATEEEGGGSVRPEITLMRDALLGSAVSMGQRDVPIEDPAALPAHIQRRNATASAVPVVIKFAGRYSLPHRIVVAPAFPDTADAVATTITDSDNSSSSINNDEEQAAAAAAAAAEFLDTHLRTCAAAVCVLPAMGWRLVQTSAWLPRLAAADPTFGHTHLVFTGLAPFLASFHTPVALADFFRGKPTAYAATSCCYATLPNDELSAACTSAAEYAGVLAALAARDAAALEKLWCDRALCSASVGVAGLRRTLAGTLRARYRDVLPRLEQHIAATRAQKAAAAERVAAQLRALDAPTLPAALRVAATERAVAFAQAVAAALRGSALPAATAAELGVTLAEEVADVLDTGFPTRGLVLADVGAVPRADARLYGGAQIDRLVAFFRASAQKAAEKHPPILLTATARCCANKAAATLPPACEAAVAQARAALVPLINFFADAAVLAIKRCADVADTVLDRRAASARKVVCQVSEGNNNNNNGDADASSSSSVAIPGLAEYSHLARNVSGIFVELASTAVEQLRDDCVEQLSTQLLAAEVFGLPAFAVGGADAAAKDGKGEWLAEQVYVRVLDHEAQAVATRFYAELLAELTSRVPAEAHATIMGFDEERITKMFKIQGLKDVLEDEQASLAEEMEKCAAKQKEISEIAIN